MQSFVLIIIDYRLSNLLFADGQSEVEVRLVVRKYVDRGSSVTLHCEHNVPLKILYKVSDVGFCSVWTDDSYY